MPAVSIDTFFACALMVLLVLSAMAGTSKILYPFTGNSMNAASADKYRQISDLILLNTGKPEDWGQNPSILPEIFGLAKEGSENPYELDPDKVSRLNQENSQSVTYAEAFETLGMPDTAFSITIGPVFDVNINLLGRAIVENETRYRFHISTVENGVLVDAHLKAFVFARDCVGNYSAVTSEGAADLDVTLAENVGDLSFLAVLAKSANDPSVMSYGVFSLSGYSSENSSSEEYLALNALDDKLTVSPNDPESEVIEAYALSYCYTSLLTPLAGPNGTVEYQFPHFADISPTLLVVTGEHVTDFFVQCTLYPRIPAQIGADLTKAQTKTRVFSLSYLVTVDSVVYKCIVQVGEIDR